MNELIAHARKLKTEELVAGAKEVNKGPLTEDKRMVRAALIEVYHERTGDAAADALMDELGM